MNSVQLRTRAFVAGSQFLGRRTGSQVRKFGTYERNGNAFMEPTANARSNDATGDHPPHCILASIHHHCISASTAIMSTKLTMATCRLCVKWCQYPVASEGSRCKSTPSLDLVKAAAATLQRVRPLLTTFVSTVAGSMMGTLRKLQAASDALPATLPRTGQYGLTPSSSQHYGHDSIARSARDIHH
jgi:hypothetical protein